MRADILASIQGLTLNPIQILLYRRAYGDKDFLPDERRALGELTEADREREWRACRVELEKRKRGVGGVRSRRNGA